MKLATALFLPKIGLRATFKYYYRLRFPKYVSPHFHEYILLSTYLKILTAAWRVMFQPDRTRADVTNSAVPHQHPVRHSSPPTSGTGVSRATFVCRAPLRQTDVPQLAARLAENR